MDAPQLAALALLALAAPEGTDAGERAAGGPTFEVRVEEGLLDEPFTGRVLVFLSKTAREPRLGGNPARLDPVVGADFEDAEGPFVLSAENALSFPVPLHDLEGGEYRVQAVLDLARDEPAPGSAPGNPMSLPRRIEVRAGASRRYTLTCDRSVPETPIVETRHARLFEMESRLLSEFHGRPVTLRALVHLPAEWHRQPDRRFPAHFFLSGFGASIEGFEFVDWPAPPLDGVPMLMVYPDPSWSTGHTGFADSDNNGPFGEAFVRELVPAVEREYRGLGAREARLLVGHSSGGWAALWLMVRYPRSFGYAWASSPDPVDFRDFMGVDLYDPSANLFRDEEGGLRPFCRLGNVWTVGYMREHSDRDRVLRGGVLSYFEALFGPRGPDGEPAPLWDRETGEVRPSVAEAWRRHDVSRILRERWDELGPLLDGRIAVTMGTGDNFLLQGSVELLARELDELGADVRVSTLPGDHFSVRAYERFPEELRAMTARYRAWRAAGGERETAPDARDPR